MEILNYKEQPSGGKVLATFEVYVPAFQMTIRRYKLMRGKNGLYITGPSFSEGEEPNKTWFQYVSFGKEKQVEFNGKVMEALQPYLK